MKQIPVTAVFIPESTQQTLFVSGYITLGCPGMREPFARFQEPDDPDEVTIEVIVDEDGNEFYESDFTDQEIKSLHQKMFEL